MVVFAILFSFFWWISTVFFCFMWNWHEYKDGYDDGYNDACKWYEQNSIQPAHDKKLD